MKSEAMISFRLATATLEKLDRDAKQRGLTRSANIVRVLNKSLRTTPAIKKEKPRERPPEPPPVSSKPDTEEIGGIPIVSMPET